jgi:hypothetical protein
MIFILLILIIIIVAGGVWISPLIWLLLIGLLLYWHKLGKKAFTGYRPGTPAFADYKPKGDTTLPTPVVPFGHGNSFTDWGMLGNDSYGDCVPAGSDHETMLIDNLAAGGKPADNVVTFVEANTLADYFAMNGVPPGPAGGTSDQGTDVQTALGYRQDTGMIDNNGTRHKIAAWVSIKPKNLQDVIDAIWIFDAVGIGINFPDSAMDQFNNGQPWSYVKGSQIDGGHYIPLVGVPATQTLALVTWGVRWTMTDQFFSEYCDEAYAYCTLESLNAKTQANWGGYNWTQLQADLKLV